MFQNHSSKCFFGHVECSFGNPEGKLSSKVRNFFAKSAKPFTKKYFLPKIFFSTGFSGHIKCNFQNPVEKIWPKLRKFLAQSPKRNINL